MAFSCKIKCLYNRHSLYIFNDRSNQLVLCLLLICSLFRSNPVSHSECSKKQCRCSCHSQSHPYIEHKKKNEGYADTDNGSCYFSQGIHSMFFHKGNIICNDRGNISNIILGKKSHWETLYPVTKVHTLTGKYFISHT